MFINTSVRFLNWEFNPSTHTLHSLNNEDTTLESTCIELEAKQALLLSYLISLDGNIASREDLQHHIWFDRYVDDKTINATISKLRRVLGGDTKSIIKTHPKQGYSFSATVLFIEPCHTPSPNPANKPYHLLGLVCVISCVLLSMLFFSTKQTEPHDSHQQAIAEPFPLKPVTFMTGWSRQPQLSKSSLLAFLHLEPELKTRSLIVQQSTANQHQTLFQLDNVSAFTWADNSDTLYYAHDSGTQCKVLKRTVKPNSFNYTDHFVTDCQSGLNLQFIAVDTLQEWLYFPDYNQDTQVHSLKRYHMQQHITEQLTFPVKTHQLDSFASVNPSNTHVAFIRFYQARHAQLMVYDLKNGSVEQLTSLAMSMTQRVSWADENTLVFNKDANTIATIDIKEKTTKDIYQTDKPISMPLLKGGTLFISVGEETTFNTVEIDLTKAQLTPNYLARSPFTNYAGTTFRTEKELKTAVVSLRTGQQEIWLIDNGIFTQLTHFSESMLSYLVFSHNGSKLLFQLDTKLGLIDLATKAITYLKVPYSELKPPVFKCDSEQVLLLPVRESNQWHLYQYNINSQQSEKLLSNIKDFHQNCKTQISYVTLPEKPGIYELDAQWQIDSQRVFFENRVFEHFRQWDADGDYMYAISNDNQLVQQHVTTREVTQRPIEAVQTSLINIESGHIILNRPHVTDTYIGQVKISENLL